MAFKIFWGFSNFNLVHKRDYITWMKVGIVIYVGINRKLFSRANVAHHKILISVTCLSLARCRQHSSISTGCLLHVYLWHIDLIFITGCLQPVYTSWKPTIFISGLPWQADNILFWLLLSTLKVTLLCLSWKRITNKKKVPVANGTSGLW